MDKLNVYIYIIIVIKIFFIASVIIHLYLKKTNKENSDIDKKAIFWKGRFEFIFEALMAGLLIYLFNPYQTRDELINHETKLLLFLFGFVLLLTANWSTFIEESILLHH